MSSRAPRHPTPSLLTRLLRVTIYVATLAAVAGWGVLHWINDANGLGMLLGFAPRWWLVLPWGVLLFFSLFLGWRLIVAAVLGAAATMLGIAHFEVNRPPADTARGDVRVVTYNTDFSQTALATRLRDDLARWDADVILLQDCKPVVADALMAVYAGAVLHNGYCIASRWPLLDVVDAADLVPASNGKPLSQRDAVRVRVQTPRGVLPVYSVHLPSPRYALSAARWLDASVLFSRLRASVIERGDASAAVSAAVQRNDRAYIVAGDFNLPYGSAILERDWGDLTNAFARVGSGFGYTMRSGIFPVRIDHVLVPDALTPIAARVLSGYPSEHQPLVVDLRWTP